jgi:hypothetical protein
MMAGACPIPFDANFGRGSEAKEPKPLTGASLVALSKKSIPHEKTLLGNRWLCIGGGAIVVGPSGAGKSTLAIQATACCSCGRPAFGIKTSRPLRVLVVQAEDDDGDSIEMACVVNELGLTKEELDLVDQNTHVEFLNDKTGFEFIRRLEEMMDAFRPEIVLINPLTSYLACDTKDEQGVNQFLRGWINPLLTRHGAAAILVHHTPKTTNRDTSDWKLADWMYSGSGVAGITNWARAYLVIEPTEIHGVYRLIAAKRWQRIGWNTSEQYWAHTTDHGKILWVPANRDQITSAKKSSKPQPEDLLRLVPELDPMLQEKLFLVASQKGFGQKKIRDFLRILVSEKKVHMHTIPRRGVKSAIGYAKNPATPEE